MIHHHPSTQTNYRKRRIVQDNASSKYIKRSDFILAEYTTLRTEILQRISTRYQLISITLTVFGAVFAIGNPYLALLYPLLAFVMLFFYSSNSDSIREANDYIRLHIETEVTEDGKNAIPTTTEDGKTISYRFGWQTYKFVEKKEKNRIIAAIFAGRLVFPISSLIAWMVGNTLNAAKSTNVPEGIILFSLGILILSFIVALLWSLFSTFSERVKSFSRIKLWR
jgi:hypothetical protein